MSKSLTNSENIAKVFIGYCSNKKYQVESLPNSNFIRLNISNILERTMVLIYHTSKIVMGGPNNQLRAEFADLKLKIEANPEEFLGIKPQNIQACTTRYDIMLPNLRGNVKESLNSIEANIEVIDVPNPNIEYRAEIIRDDYRVILTQYNNGTLLIQGRTDKLFYDICDQIEKFASPSEKEVIARFISSDENYLKIFSAKYTPELITLAEDNVKAKLGIVYDFLEPYDKKWFVASECLCLTEIPLPEFSPLVMPASKAFEGFAKKLLVGIGLFEPDHFKNKGANFCSLYDEKDPKRIIICGKEKYAGTFLKRIGLCLDINRNFMMHSDESTITKVDTLEEAKEKVNSIFKDTREIFDYFNNLYHFLP